MGPRPQVHHTNVAFAHAEHVTRNHVVEGNLIEFGSGNRLNAHRLALDRFGQRVVALLDLGVVVRFDHPEVERRGALLGRRRVVLPENRGRILQMIGIAEDLIAQAKKDHGRNFAILCQDAVKRVLHLRLRVALVVLEARDEKEPQPFCKRNLIGRNAQCRRVEIIDLRAYFDYPRFGGAQHAHRLCFEMQRELLAVPRVLRRIVDDQIDGIARDVIRAHQRREHRIGKRRDPRLIEQRRPRGGVRTTVVADVCTQFFGQAQGR